MSTKKLSGKTALVTGAESGIGRSIATAFAWQGASVAITYLHDRVAAEQTLSAVQKQGPLVLLSRPMSAKKKM